MENWRDVVEERKRVRWGESLLVMGLKVFAIGAIAVREGREAVARRRRRSAERQEEQIMTVTWQFEFVCLKMMSSREMKVRSNAVGRIIQRN